MRRLLRRAARMVLNGMAYLMLLIMFELAASIVGTLASMLIEGAGAPFHFSGPMIVSAVFGVIGWLSAVLYIELDPDDAH